MPESNITKSPGMQKRKERTAVRRIFIALALSVFGRFAIQHCPQVYIPCTSPRNHADYTNAILINTPAAFWHAQTKKGTASH